MSDCSNSRMEPYAPQDVCKLRVYFYGQTEPWTYPLALNGRVIKDVMVGDVHYVPERTCEANVGEGERRGWWVCESCGDLFDSLSGLACKKEKKPNYCPNCGARVVSA